MHTLINIVCKARHPGIYLKSRENWISISWKLRKFSEKFSIVGKLFLHEEGPPKRGIRRRDWRNCGELRSSFIEIKEKIMKIRKNHADITEKYYRNVWKARMKFENISWRRFYQNSKIRGLSQRSCTVILKYKEIVSKAICQVSINNMLRLKLQLLPLVQEKSFGKRIINYFQRLRLID